MRRRFPSSWVLVPFALASAILAALPLTTPTAVSAEPPVKTVRVGLIRSVFRDAPDPLVKIATNLFKTLLEAQTGVANEVSVPADAADMAAQMKDGKIQIGVFHGFEFAWARQKNPDLKGLVVAVKRQPFVGALLVVRQQNKAADALALKGQKLALSRLARAHCRIFLQRRCLQPGTPMDQWFAQVTTPGTDQDALDDVAEGHADAAVVDDVELALFRAKFPKTAEKLRVLAKSEVFPCTVVAYQPGALDADTLKRLRDGMLVSATTERGRKLLDLFHMTGFEAVPANYEQNLADILKAYPPAVK